MKYTTSSCLIPYGVFIAALLFLGCSDTAHPHKVLLSKVTDNYGTITDLAYNGANQIVSIKKTSTSKSENTTLTYQGDSVILDSGGETTVIKYENSLPTKQYTFLKTKPDSVYFIKNFKHSNMLIASATFITKDPGQPDSSVSYYTWNDGNVSQTNSKSYKYGGVSSEVTWINTFDKGRNFSNSDYLISFALGFEGQLFVLCKNNIVGTKLSDNAINNCCYEYNYNSNQYPSAIKGIQLDTYTLEYIEPK